MPRPTAQRRLPSRQPPPDYTQRSVRLKLFALVAGLILVLAVAERAGDPKAWEWMWRLDERSAEREAPFNNRLQPKPLLTANDPDGTFIAAGETLGEDNPATDQADPLPPDALGSDESAEPPDQAAFDPVARAWEQGWRDVFDRLEPAERSLLFECLHAGLHHQALPAERMAAAAELLHQAQTLWEDYQAVAFQSVAELRGDDQALWVDVLRRANGRFANELRPALQAVADGRTPTEAEEQALAGLQTPLETLTMARIEDDTIFRPAEREIWFHLLARVRETEPAALRGQSAGQVAYLQLFKQPNEYRSRVVTVEGTVRLAYRVQAPENYLGIGQYYVFWIHPRGGPSAPIVVYALDAPAGFPPIPDKDIPDNDLDRGTTKLQEEVTVTGVFFKRWAYAGQDGTYTAPLLIAHTPTWHPAPSAAEAARQALGPREYVAIVAAALLLALCATAALWHRTRSQRSAWEAYGPASTDLAALRDVPLAPSPQETLKHLEGEARSEP
jgi:hypothetical protein